MLGSICERLLLKSWNGIRFVLPLCWFVTVLGIVVGTKPIPPLAKINPGESSRNAHSECQPFHGVGSDVAIYFMNGYGNFKL